MSLNSGRPRASWFRLGQETTLERTRELCRSRKAALPTPSWQCRAHVRSSLHSRKPPRSWLVSLARSSLLSVLQHSIKTGSLAIHDVDGSIHRFGRRNKSQSNDITLRVTNDEFWIRVVVSSDLGFSEAYIYGDVEISDLNGVMELYLDNAEMISSLPSALARLSATFSALSSAFFGQSKARALANVVVSYDQSNELFKAFLSREMMYSCALWGPEEGGVEGDGDGGRDAEKHEETECDLEQAQMRKIHYVLRKAKVGYGSRVLEVGSGWGALAIVAARDYGCTVHSLTLSVEQKKLAEERIREAGVEDRVVVHLMDYRDVLSKPEWAGWFDAFVSVEMVEHVGAKYYNTYFKVMDYALKDKDSTAVISCSTFPESRYSEYQAEDFMRRYMWPNSCLPSATTLVNAAQAGTQGRLMLEGVENHAAHYPRTLRTWSSRFAANVHRELLPFASGEAYAAFERKWRYFFAYAEVGFLKGWITCHMLCFKRN
ncbi:cyclopropane-fatty-acyl-phospholipid synthase [Gloeophyllum trabeum ATCC 11539]|uniref:Cyclopropane-fatty-acyl-phospholipid synthase n=1 Tax=Gloeophyllum trabeum (strain ATCC 11539 / FP-39264 / Madison 617) TaxID=670483 RepID=S7QK28_GLOTA|nr:cyclopropane-fatty-acyl-phospholipid synthase [Gloeophyllum trabeum ATCC 11539]EPQ59732.1 cyclopropane-fatty-acyl-phospholipid synthase [Gloeophyllum trabeum ATCC 11539]